MQTPPRSGWLSSCAHPTTDIEKCRPTVKMRRGFSAWVKCTIIRVNLQRAIAYSLIMSLSACWRKWLATLCAHLLKCSALALFVGSTLQRAISAWRCLVFVRGDSVGSERSHLRPSIRLSSAVAWNRKASLWRGFDTWISRIRSQRLQSLKMKLALVSLRPVGQQPCTCVE